MSRPRKSSKARNLSFSCPPDLFEIIHPMPERSRFVVDAIRAHLGAHTDELLIAELRGIDRRIEQNDRENVELRVVKSQKEQSLRRQQVKQNRSVEARLRLLESLKKIPSGGRMNWLRSRADVLVECEFCDANEAEKWFENQVR